MCVVLKTSDAFVEDLPSLPWDTIYLFDSPEDAWFAMVELLQDIGNKHAPVCTMRAWLAISLDDQRNSPINEI